ncbi:type ISP restriction/modification enzyme [uncultured Rhodoblastus sp.]|uniref:type ISP restriction/modification enzyme n=1 Tax=uncultured Rhodoblastus sp. TaxID=543037 RepID=UPI0025CC3B03|nr:type ISP restriction/modification enzyme [uncultured Rhodoblastus sp.]
MGVRGESPSSGPSGHLLPPKGVPKDAHLTTDYGENGEKGPITKDAIFHCVYGVLHDPIYREKYAQNLKHEFPRIPFYPDFWVWAGWGQRLMALHIGFETFEPWPLTRIETPDARARVAGRLGIVVCRSPPATDPSRWSSLSRRAACPVGYCRRH